MKAMWPSSAFSRLNTWYKSLSHLTSALERSKRYERAQIVFKKQAPWFPIAHTIQLKPVHKEVIDFKLSPFGRHTFYSVDIKE